VGGVAEGARRNDATMTRADIVKYWGEANLVRWPPKQLRDAPIPVPFEGATVSFSEWLIVQNAPTGKIAFFALMLFRLSFVQAASFGRWRDFQIR
jgi:hypothetical protein